MLFISVDRNYQRLCWEASCSLKLLFYSTQFHSFLFHSIPLHSILFYSTLFYSTLFYTIICLFLFHSVTPFHSDSFQSILFSFHFPIPSYYYIALFHSNLPTCIYSDQCHWSSLEALVLQARGAISDGGNSLC